MTNHTVSAQQDIVERLRDVAGIETGLLYSRRSILNDATDIITALRQQVEDLTAATLDPNKGLWAFWNDKANEFLARAEAAEAELAALRAGNERLKDALQKIADTNQVPEFMGDDASDGYGNQGWVTRNGQYAEIARSALSPLPSEDSNNGGEL